MFTYRAIAMWVILFILMPIYAFAASDNEVVSMRTEYAKTFSNVDGSFTSHVYLQPIHYKDVSGEWVDISADVLSSGIAKAAYDSTAINYPYLDAGRDSGGTYVFSDIDVPKGKDDDGNIVGNLTDREGEPERTYRQIFRWDISFFPNGGTISISDMYYSFNNINSTTGPDTLAVTKVADDPASWSAQSVWNNTTMWTPFTYVCIIPNQDRTPKKYKVDLASDISTLQGRANNATYKNDRSDLWYAVHHKMKTEGSSHGIDLCTAVVGSQVCGYLAITWTRSYPKIVKDPHPVSINPNPFNPTTTLSFILEKPGNIKLEIFSITGQKVSTLVNNYMQAGLHDYVFDGSHLASGMYFYRLNSAEFISAGKFMLLK